MHFKSNAGQSREIWREACGRHLFLSRFECTLSLSHTHTHTHTRGRRSSSAQNTPRLYRSCRALDGLQFAHNAQSETETVLGVVT